LSAYRFCRTDDIGLLVDALNRCWAPSFPDAPPIDAAAFKRSIRDLQVWCSSCMVAFSGADPIGVLIGAKRPSATLVHKIAVHPDHQRQGHGRHLLSSLSSKLAILGPPRIVSEVSETNAPARALFRAAGYVEEALLTDYASAAMFARRERAPLDGTTRMVIPVALGDLVANGLLEGGPDTCWERSLETLTAQKDEIGGLAIATDERIEACVLYIKDEFRVVLLRSFVEDGGIRLRTLLSHVPAAFGGAVRFPKVHPAEIPREGLETLGFRASGRHLVYVTKPRSE
jgi:GNAT superfamily N-acetyltransferase